MDTEDDKKHNDSKIIAKYNEFEIITDKIFFSLTSLLSIYLFYNKLIDNFMTKWQVCFFPTYIFITLNFLKVFYRIIKQEQEENEHHAFIYVRVRNLDNILIASNFFFLILYAEAFLVIFYFCEFMDYKKDEYLFYSVYSLLAILTTHVMYCLVRLLPMFKLDSHNNYSDNNEQGSTTTAFVGSLMAPILTYFSNMMIVCNASAGTCTQIYMSTITSIFGAFGVTISDFSDYLFPVTVVLLLVSLFSLYINKRKILHPPFLLGVFSTFIIILSHFVETLWILLYVGNILMIVAAIWNARLNKFYGLPSFK